MNEVRKIAYVEDLKGKMNKELPLYIENSLIEAHYSMPVAEQRIILAYVSQISNNDDELPELEIAVKDFCKMLSLSDPNYSFIKDKINSLASKSLKIKEVNGYIVYPWFQMIKYEEKQGKVSMLLNSKLSPYFIQLKETFTRLVTEQMMQFDSQYAIRVYMFCKQYCHMQKNAEGLTERTFQIDELRKMLGISPKEYKRYFNFKSRILDQAVKEINNKSDIYVNYEEIKQARKVVSVKFIFNKENKLTYISDWLEKISTKKMCDLIKEVNRLLKAKFKFEYPIIELQNYKKETLIELISALSRNAYDANKIKSPTAYFNKALENIENGISLF